MPRLEVAARGILLDGDLIATPTSGELKRIDALMDRLKARLAALPDPKAVPPYELVVNHDADLTVVKSAFQTAAFSGWNSAYLQTTAGKVLLSARIPKPVGAENEKPPVASAAHTVLVMRPDETELWMSAPFVAEHLPASSAPGGLGIRGKKDSKPEPRVRIAAFSTKLASAEATVNLSAYCRSAAPCPEAAVLLDRGVATTDLLNWAAAFKATCDNSHAANCELGLRINDPPSKGTPPDQGVPSTRALTTTVSGRIPPEEIQRVVRSSYGKIRDCYTRGLSRDPELNGRVVLRFVIDRRGKVTKAELEPESTLPDAPTKECIRAVYPTLQFPKPEGGIVTVVYPLVFEPEQ